jgi:hypothetical protein
VNPTRSGAFMRPRMRRSTRLSAITTMCFWIFKSGCLPGNRSHVLRGHKQRTTWPAHKFVMLLSYSKSAE